MKTMTGRRYWWTLAGLTLVLVISASGIIAICCLPESPSPKYFVVPKITNPRFTFRRHLLVDAAGWEWSEEEEVPQAKARNILRLLRGSPTWEEVWDEYRHRHPDEPVILRQFDHTIYYSLSVYEAGSARPKLTVAFESGNRVWVNRDLYVVRQSSRSKLRDELATLDDENVVEKVAE